MPTKKEKIIIKIIQRQGGGSTVVNESTVTDKSGGQITASDISQILNYFPTSEYIKRPGASTSQLQLTLKGQDYVQTHKQNLIKEWIVIIASVIVAISGILALIYK